MQLKVFGIGAIENLDHSPATVFCCTTDRYHTSYLTCLSATGYANTRLGIKHGTTSHPTKEQVVEEPFTYLLEASTI